jgi:hypothetical protein
MGARSGQRNAEEWKRSRLRMKAGKIAAKFEDKIDGREEYRILTECWREKKNNKEKKEREKYVLPEERVCQWRSGKIESKSKRKTKTRTSKKEGRESKNPDTTGSMRGV